MFKIESKHGDYFEGNFEVFDKLLREAYSKSKDLTKRLPGDDTTWKYVSEKKGCKIYSKDIKGSNFKVFQGILNVKTKRKVEEIAEYIHNILVFHTEVHERIHRKIAESMTKRMTIMYNKKFFTIVYVELKSPSLLVFPRDLMAMRDFYFEGEDDSCYIISRSIPKELINECHEKREERIFPKGDGYVRTNLFLNCLKITRKGPEDVVLQSISHISPGGWIPPLFFNMMAGDGVLTIQRMNEGMKEFWRNER